MSRAIAYTVGNSGSVLEMAYSSNPNHRVAGEIVTDSLHLAPSLAAIKNSADLQVRVKRAEKTQKRVRKILMKCKKMEYSAVKEKEFLTLLKNDIYHFERLLSEWLVHLQLRQKRN